MKTKNTSVRIINVPKKLHSQFRRALQISGKGSQALWLITQVRRFVRQQEAEFGDLFDVLTAEEADLLEVIDSGCAEVEFISEESKLSIARVEKLLADLVKRGLVEIRAKGGRSEIARGATTKLYFVKDRRRNSREESGA